MDNETGRTPRWASLLPATCFFLTVAGARLVAYCMTQGWCNDRYWEPLPGTHVHHFAYGIAGLIAMGFLRLFAEGAKRRYVTRMLFYVSTGLITDEFGMWFKFREDAGDPLSLWAIGVVSLIVLVVEIFRMRNTKPLYDRRKGGGAW